MQASSPEEFASAKPRSLPQSELVHNGVWSVPMRMPGYLPYSICYLIVGDRGDAHIVDPGWDLDKNWDALQIALANAGSSLDDVTSILVTHMHPDHIGMAERVRQSTDAPIALHRLEQNTLDSYRNEQAEIESAGSLEVWGVPEEHIEALKATRRRQRRVPFITADLELYDNDLLDISGRNVRVLWTPGHTAGHVCFRDEDSRLLFTGDHVLPGAFGGIGLGGSTGRNPLRDYFDSLRVIATFDGDTVCPGHEYRFTGLRQRCSKIEQHHLLRSREVGLLLHDSEKLSVWEIARRIKWSAGWDKLEGFYLYAALSQTAMYLDYFAQTSRN